MSKEENIEFLKNALKNAEGNTEEKPYTDEDLWADIRKRAGELIRGSSMCVTSEAKEDLKAQIDMFRGASSDMIRGICDRYKRDYLAEELKVRKAHEMNEAAKLYTTNPNAGSLIMAGLAQMFNMQVPQGETQPIKAINSTKEEVIADVTLSED